MDLPSVLVKIIDKLGEAGFKFGVKEGVEESGVDLTKEQQSDHVVAAGASMAGTWLVVKDLQPIVEKWCRISLLRSVVRLLASPLA